MLGIFKYENKMEKVAYSKKVETSVSVKEPKEHRYRNMYLCSLE